MVSLLVWLFQRRASVRIGSRRECRSERCAQTEQSPHPQSPPMAWEKRGKCLLGRSCDRISQDTIPAHCRGNAQGLRWQATDGPKTRLIIIH